MPVLSQDHVIPLSHGGTITVVVCVACNNRKGDMPPDVFLQTLQGCQYTSARIAMISAVKKEARIEEMKIKGQFSTSAFDEAFRAAAMAKARSR